MSATYTHRMLIHGAVVLHNEQNTAARVTLPALAEGADEPSFELVSEPGKPGKLQPEPNATQQAIAVAKEGLKVRMEAEAEAERRAVQASIDKAKQRAGGPQRG